MSLLAPPGPNGICRRDAGSSRSFPAPHGARRHNPIKQETWCRWADLCHPGPEAGCRVPGTPLGGTVGRCPDRGNLNDPAYRLLQSLPANPMPCSQRSTG